MCHAGTGATLHAGIRNRQVRLAEDSWNTRDPQRVCLGYTEDCRWRNRAEFPVGRSEIIAFLTRKWAKELDYRLIKELWAFTDNHIAVPVSSATRLVARSTPALLLRH
jgi:nuclear transport factor 2 (NTF2) superfamily protein